MFAQQQQQQQQRQQQQQQQQEPVNAYGQNAQQAAAMQTAMDPAAGCTYCPHIMIGIGVVLFIPGVVLAIMMASSNPFDFPAGPAGPFFLIIGVFLALTGSLCMCHRRRVLAAQQAGLPLGYYGWMGGRRQNYNRGMPPGAYGPGYGPQPGYGPHAGFGHQPGYGPHAGYGAQPGYGAQAGYGPQADYGPSAGYPPASSAFPMGGDGFQHSSGMDPPSYDSTANKY